MFAIEPEECPILAGGGWGPHRIEGIGDGFIPDNLHLDVLDGVVEVSSDEAIAMARRLAREEGIFCGISSGCNVAGALKAGTARVPSCGRSSPSSRTTACAISRLNSVERRPNWTCRTGTSNQRARRREAGVNDPLAVIR